MSAAREDLQGIYEEICGMKECPPTIEQIIDLSSRFLGNPWTRTLGKYAGLPVAAIFDTYRIGSVLIDDLREGKGFDNSKNVLAQKAGSWAGGMAGATVGTIIGTAVGGGLGLCFGGAKAVIGAAIGGFSGYFIGATLGDSYGSNYAGGHYERRSS
ncbi:hypothetical protein Ddc_15902 [Ditylenchus destructor]|nr:hypothetical protein Ddc_15902 [Ditylenchus destructor]